jgi:hypothetical protein
MEEYKKLLQPFVNQILSGKNYTPAGIEAAFIAFQALLEIKVFKPAPLNVERENFVKTTLQEAVAAAKLPVEILVEKNSYGNMESLVYPGLLFKEDPKEKDLWIAYAMQDGPKEAPLTMNAVLVCCANGFLYDGKNLAGSAALTSSELRKE